MFTIKSFGVSGNFILLFVILSNIFVTFSKCIDKPDVDCVLSEKLYIGMQENELLKYMEEEKWRIVPKTRLFAAKNIEGKDYSFDFLWVYPDFPNSVVR